MQITWLNEVDSTNQEASRHLAKAEEGSVWASLYQTAGRGQQTNVWESEPGENLLFSLLLRPAWLPAEEQFYISKVASLGVYDFLLQHGIPSTVKWPNDGYVNDKKIAGILIENHIMGNVVGASIIGIGLNVNQKQFSPKAAKPTSMLLEKDGVVAIKEALPVLLACILTRYEALKSGAVAQIDADYLAHLYRFNEWHWFFYNSGQGFRAKITGVQANGQLLLQGENGKTTPFAFKEISFAG
jgi:BirA family biotin operon repressor/biotin-[acetyl-CoA-carboxylase] ligase